MNCRINLLLALSVQFVCLVSVLEAYSNGDLTAACSTMAPVHDGTAPSTDPCPYETVPSQTTIVQGGSLTITLRNITTTSFKGNMTMAFDASKSDEAGPVGTFGMPTDGQILSCPDGVNNTISHQDNNSIKKFVQAIWTAPVDFVGSVVFKTTFVRGEAIYWVKEPSTENVAVTTF
ncbi:putative ferric-chelate reductase 1 [Daphnia pulicaria]|uniref:putative ferric-chelate reductase 1 n=1 Tax=Daphnia pulicaria TaxID=35523 RepID=UPI001EEB5876|nr:putative ferric-chelate reductase 1 [Daphnia pulicaria]